MIDHGSITRRKSRRLRLNALPIEVAGIASAAILTRDFPVEAKRRPFVDTGRVLVEMFRQMLATQGAHHLRVPGRDRSYRLVAQNCIHFEHLVL
jgi:hypothetical protein